MPLIRTCLLLLLTALAGCSSSNPKDPFESYNRAAFRFNDTVDKAVLKPVAQGYNKVTPKPAKNMIHNFFSNLDDVLVTFNDLLQLKFSQAAADGTRVVINSTFGVFGLINVADRLEKHNEDFGQTLGYWGVSSGPYLVIPILGPSSVRDGAGLYVDSSYLSPIGTMDDVGTRNRLYIGKGVEARASLLEVEEVLDENMLDRYSFIRDAYMMRRQNLVYDGNPPKQKFEDDDE